MLYPEYKRKSLRILSELSGGLQIQNDLAGEILKDESKKKIIVISGRDVLCTSKVAAMGSV